MSLRVSVIIVAFRGDEWLPGCLETLRTAARTPMRLILVDNGGTSSMEGLPLAEFDHLVVPTPGPLGFAEANNLGLQHVDFDTEAVCFLNQDTLSGDGWLEACLECLRVRPGLGAVTPLIATYDRQGWDQAFWECARRSEQFCQHFDTDGDLEAFYETPVITAAAMVVRTEGLLKAGPFDPIYGSYYEDYDLCHRIREAGYRVGVCTRGRVAHYSGSATNTDDRRSVRMRQIIRNRCIYRLRQSGSSRLRAALRYLLREFTYGLGRSLIRTPSSQPLGVYLGAHGDLFPLLGRLLSWNRDVREWNRYLVGLNWPPLPSTDFPHTTATSNAEHQLT